MNKFSETSLSRMEYVHPSLVILCYDVLPYFDITVIYGIRTKAQQKKLFDSGFSKTLNSLHLPQEDGLSHAIDIAPYPINWDDKLPFYFLAGMMKAFAIKRGIEITWGGDWDNDNNFHDQSWYDLAHFQLVNPRKLKYLGQN